MLEGKRNLSRESRLFEAVVDWIKLPLQIDEKYKHKIGQLVCEAFNVNEEEIRAAILKSTTVEKLKTTSAENVVEASKIAIDTTTQALKDEAHLRTIMPSTGYFASYCDYTENSEAPLAYHIFCAIAGFVATINRRVFFDMGNAKLFPPFGILILGPSGIKKTSAADIIVNILNEMQLTPVYAEKLTPEALIDAMKGGNATGLVYSPEMTVLISKQRYMESIIPLLTRFMDSPDIWKSETIMRGKGALTDIAITCLMCSTLDWFIKNTPENIFGGGFIARNIMVLQEKSARTIPLPRKSDPKLRDKLILELATLHQFQGEIFLSDATTKRHAEWYTHDKHHRLVEHEILETYYQRKPSHMLRIAIALHMATHGDLVVCETCWQRAFDLLAYIERFLPNLVNKMFKSPWGEDQDLVLRKIRGCGGSIAHSELVRKMQYKMSANQTRQIVGSLKESRLITEIHNAIEHTYYLTEAANEY